MNRRVIIIGSIITIIVLIIVGVVILLSRRGGLQTISFKKTDVLNAQRIIGLQGNSLIFFTNQGLFSMSGSNKVEIQKDAGFAKLLENNNQLFYNITKRSNTAFDSLNATGYLKNISNNTAEYPGTYSILFCGGEKYFYKPDSIFNYYLVDAKGRTILPAETYENIFCLGENVYYTTGEGGTSRILKSVNLVTARANPDFDLGIEPTIIFNNNEYFYFADTAKIYTYDKRLQKTETNAYGIQSALSYNSNKEIYFVQPPVINSNEPSPSYTEPLLMKFDMNTKKTQPVAIISLDASTLKSVQSGSSSARIFKQVEFDKASKKIYILIGNIIYEGKAK